MTDPRIELFVLVEPRLSIDVSPLGEATASTTTRPITLADYQRPIVVVSELRAVYVLV